MKKLVKFPEVLFFQEGPGVRNTQYTSEGVKLLNVANLVEGRVDLSTSDRFISRHEAYGKYKHFLCDDGDFIIASSGIKVKYVDKKMGFVDESMLPLCMNTSTIRFKVLNNKELNIRYFMYYLKSKHFKAQLGKHITGSAQLNYGPSHLKDMTLPMTDISIQNNIVNILDKIQNIINISEIMLEKLDKLVKARFVEDFGNPVTNEKGWRKEYLKDVCYKINDGTHFSPESFETGDYKYVTAKNIKIDGFDFSNITYVSGEVHKLIYERCNPEYGDVLYIKDGVTTGTAMVNTLEEEFTLLSSVALLKQDRNIMNGFFLCNLLNNKEMYLDIRRNMGGAAITRLTITKLNEIQIIVPPIQLQNEFANFVKEVNKSKLLAASQPQIHIYKTLTLL